MLLFLNSLRQTVIHALDTGNLVRALQEERAAVLLNTLLLEPGINDINTTIAPQNSKTEKTEKEKR